MKIIAFATMCVFLLRISADAKKHKRHKRYSNQNDLDSALKNGNETAAVELIKNGADAKRRFENGNAMYMAAEKGMDKVVQALIDNGYKYQMFDCEPLLAAAQYGHVNVARVLLQNGDCVNCKGYNGRTPLMWAAQNGHVPMLEFLIQSGSFIESLDDLNRTALQIAALTAQPEAVDFLIQKGSDVNRMHVGDALEGYTALHMVVRRGTYGGFTSRRKMVVKILLCNGADINALSGLNMTPRDIVIQKGCTRFIQWYDAAVKDMNILCQNDTSNDGYLETDDDTC